MVAVHDEERQQQQHEGRGAAGRLVAGLNGSEQAKPERRKYRLEPSGNSGQVKSTVQHTAKEEVGGPSGVLEGLLHSNTAQ